jgi:uncharacterized protein involved in type VI secretion and phage assembly
MSLQKKFYGKFRGIVSNNQDPLFRGRIQAKVPAVLGDQDTGWALPCVPYAGSGVGFFAIPPNNANVWVEFEDGNLDHPIWTGVFWGEGESPVSDPSYMTKTLATDNVTITIDDTPGAGGITIETASGMQLQMDSTGITLTCGSSTISLNQESVSINDGALEVT